jgi:type IV pilus assembly protein PilA
MFSSVIERLRDRRGGAGDIGEDAGFTLIELMVVLLILAILLAIAIPTFLGVTKSANDRAVQSNLNTAETNAKSVFTNNGQTYLGVTQSMLSSAEPSLGWTSGASTSSAQVSFAVSTDGNGIVLASESSSKNCWILVDNTSAITQTTAPYVSPPTANPSTPTVTAGASLPITAGLFYVEIKGNVTSCSASAPSIPAGSTYQYQSSGGFPS